MARKTKKPLPEVQPVRVNRLVEFLDRRARAIAIAAVLIAVLRIVSTYSEMGVTFDEPAHLATGMQYLAQHVYRYEPQHPPLARAMAAAGPYLGGVRPMSLPSRWAEGVEEYYQGGQPGRTVMLSRLGILPFFLLACLTLYLWGRRHFDEKTAAAAVVLFSLIPPVLAHAGLATTDMALTACLGAAFFAMLLWAETPSWRNSVVFGLSVALAVLSKFTALGFFPAAAVLALAAWYAAARPDASHVASLAKARALPLVAAAATGAFAIWAVYLFSFGKPQGWSLSVPAPELFDGIAWAVRHNRSEGGGYLFGKLSPTGWWYFFPVVLSLKTPIGFLLLAASGVYLSLRKHRDIRRLLPVALVLGVVLPAMTSPVNYGVRHVLPVYLGLALAAAAAAIRLLERGTIGQAAAAVLVVWMAASGALHHPDYLAYTNEFVGKEPENYVVDSDLDWGQQSIRLARRLRELGAKEVSYFTMNFDSEHLQKWPGLPPVKPIHPLIPVEGWTAVSPTFWKVGQYGLDHKTPGVEPWFTAIPPVERVGSLLLYYVPPGTLQQMR